MKGAANSSEKKRLVRLGAKAGKAFGSSSMYAKKKYPSKGAGMQREFTIPGGKARNRPDRLQRGGSVGRKHPPAHTNIIISHAGGQGGGRVPAAPVPAAVPIRRPVPVPVNRPVPVPVRPPIAPPVGAAAPIGGAVPPPMGAGMPPIRPPGMKRGGAVKKAKGGGVGYRGSPYSPTTEVDSTVSPRKKGGVVYKRGGRVKGLAAGGPADGGDDNGDNGEPEGLQFGGGAFGSMPARPAAQQQPGGLGGLLGNIPGRTPMGPQQGPPTISGRPMIPAQPVTVPMPATLASFRARPAPGTMAGFKKGGGVHSDVAEDKKLFKKMYKEEEAKEEKAGKRKRGGVVNPGTPSKARGLAGSSYKQWGKGYQAGGIVKTPLTNATGGGAGGKGRLAKSKAAARVPDKTEA
jgi:hypothetical protein